jgi:hypothetical protein
MNSKQIRRPIFCAGLPRSASTWAFNIAAALARLSGPRTHVTMVYSDGNGSSEDRMLLQEGIVLVKTHMPSPVLSSAAAWSGASVLLTIRDPRDSVASLMGQFGFGFAEAVRAASASASALLQLARSCTPLLLKYEDGFTSGSDGIDAIASFLGFEITEDIRTELAGEFSREAVSKLVGETKFKEMPDGGLPLPEVNPESQWHPNHVGDGSIRKFRGVLTREQIAVVEYETRDFSRHFGYDVSARERLGPGSCMVFSYDGLGADCLSTGFSFIEDWGVWTSEETAVLDFMLERPAEEWLSLEMECRLAPVFKMVPASRAELWVNGQRRLVIGRTAAESESVRFVLWLQDGSVIGTDRVRLEFRASGVRSPHELGLSGDKRRIGLGLRTMAIDYG